MRRVRRVVGFPNARSKRRYGKMPKRMGGPLAILEPVSVRTPKSLRLLQSHRFANVVSQAVNVAPVLCCSAVHPARFFRLLWKHAAPLKPFISSMQKVRR